MAVFIPYSVDNPPPISMRRGIYSINKDITAYGTATGATSFYLTTSSGISLDIVIKPQVSSNIGLYDISTGKYGFPAGGLSSSGWNGVLKPSYNGTFSIAIRNNSSQTANYSGTITV